MKIKFINLYKIIKFHQFIKCENKFNILFCSPSRIYIKLQEGEKKWLFILKKLQIISGDPLVISGQGTIGMEIMEDLPDVENILIPVGGGGLLSGIATAAKTINSKVKIYGIETESAPGAYNSFKKNKLDEDIEILPSLTDGLLGALTPLTFEIAKKYTETIIVVSEESIKQAMCAFQEAEELMIESAASVGLAAILSNKVKLRRNSKCVLVLTSRNISAEKYNKVISEKY